MTIDIVSDQIFMAEVLGFIIEFSLDILVSSFYRSQLDYDGFVYYIIEEGCQKTAEKVTHKPNPTVFEWIPLSFSGLLNGYCESDGWIDQQARQRCKA